MSGDTAKSLEILGEVLKQQPQDMPLRLVYARALAGANRQEEALEQFETLLKQFPDSPEVLLGTALLSLDLQRFDKAEEYLTQLSRQPKRAAEASFYLGAVAEAKRIMPRRKVVRRRTGGRGQLSQCPDPHGRHYG